MAVAVRLLGRPLIRVGGQALEPPADRRSALLCYLAYVGRWVPRDDLLYLFWPDSEERKARTNLRQLLHVTRHTWFGTGLEVERARVRWLVATDLPGRDDPAIPLDWTGDVLEGFHLPGAPEFESWLELERASWRQHYRAALLASLSRGPEEEKSLARLDEWLSIAPFDEEILRHWMQLAGRTGQRTTALGRFAKFESNLIEETGLTPDPATVAVAERLRDRAPDRGDVGPDDQGNASRAPDPGRPTPRQLPHHHGRSFLGRQVELARLAHELTTGRGVVVTLLAPGGMGKTRLACEVAERLAPRFPDGVAFVSLVGVTSTSDVAPRFAEALGLGSVRSSALEAVDEALDGSRSLVVLDNLEQIENVAELIERWRELAPGVAWLLTSRARVWVKSESILELAGLPHLAADTSPAAASPAVELLLDRARRAGRDFDAQADRSSLAQVARLTGGMPLALELAAGWLRVMPLAAVAEELQRGLLLEATPGSVHEPRHASLRTVFDSAWRALGEAEKGALTRLAAFRGGFDERAALEIAEVGRPMLLALRNWSMLSLDDAGRFFWHPLLETYIRERAEDRPSESVRERHARFFMDLLLRCESLGQRGDGPCAVATIRAEEANIEHAWRTAVELGWWETLILSGPFLGYAYDAQGRLDRWSDLLLGALERVPAGSVPWAVLEVHQSSMDGLQRRHERAYDRRSAAVRVLSAHAEESPYGLAWGLIALSDAAWNLNRPHEARSAMHGAIDALERANRRDLLGRAYFEMLCMMHDPVEHESWYERYMSWLAEAGSDENYAHVLSARGSYLSFALGEHARGLELVNEALRLQRAAGWRYGEIGVLLLRSAEILALAGDLDAAVANVEEYLESWRPTWGIVHRGRLSEAVALRATLGLQRGEAGMGELVSPGSEAAATLRGLLALAQLARLRGAHAEARGYLDQLMTRARHERVGYEQGWWLVLAHLEHVAVASGLMDGTRLATSLRDAIDTALSWNLLPLLLRALALARPVVSAALSQDLGEPVSWPRARDLAKLVAAELEEGVAGGVSPRYLDATGRSI